MCRYGDKLIVDKSVFSLNIIDKNAVWVVFFEISLRSEEKVNI
jgi:hypothetical protein